MRNINPNYQGGFDLTKDLVAYIDEAGDEGFTEGSTDWFGVSALVTTQAVSNQMLQEVNKCFDGKPGKTFKKLSHGKRKDILAKLAKYNYLTVHSFFHKPSLDAVKDHLCIYPSMYFVGIKNLVERISWLTKQYGRNRCHILISERNQINLDNLKQYLFENSVITLKGGKNLYYPSTIGVVAVSGVKKHEKLILGDYTASSMFQSLEEETEAKITEKIYAELFLQKKIYASSHPRYKGVWKNGIKITPEDPAFIKLEGILEEGSCTF